MYQLLTELVRLVREQPGIFPVLFGGLLIVVNAPGSPVFLNLDPVLCSLLTHAGFTILAVGCVSLFFKRFITSQSKGIATVQAALDDLRSTITPGHELNARLDDLEDRTIVVEDTQGRMLDMTTTPYYEANRKGRVIYCNQAYAAMYGVSTADLLTSQPLKWIHPREQARVNADTMRAIENRGGYEIKTRIVKSGRDRCKAIFTGTPLFDAGGNFTGHYGTVKVVEDYRNN